jgi:hypothetical protein
MTTAFVKIHSFINSLKDDEVIRATDQKLSDAELKKDKNAKFENNKGATHLYVRSGLLSKLRQALTSSTDGAIQKQHLAKELIFKTLDNLPDDLKNNDSVKKSIQNITDTLKNNELKDFTAGMIRNDLDVINDAFKLQEGKVNPLYENNPQKQLNPLYKGSPTEPNPSKSGANNTVAATTPTAGKNIPPDGAEESFDSSLGSEVKNQEKIMARSEEKSESDIYFDADEELASEFESAVDDSAVSKISSDEVIPTHFDTARLVLNSLDSAVDRSPVEDESSDPARSAETISTAPPKLREVIEKVTVLAEDAIESTPNATTSVSSSKTETKTNAKANPYLESLKTEWDPADDGYHTITKPFFITGGIPTTSMIAQAYLIPAGKKLNFAEEVDVLSSGLDGGVVQAKHILHKHRDTDTQRDTRPYLKLSAKAPNSIIVAPSNFTKNSKNKQQMLDRFKADLKNTYLESFKKINEEHKKINSGKQLETLVIVPLSSLPLILSEVESEVLASAVISIQNENPDLKIHVSAAETLHENRIRSAYEKILKEST